MMAGLTERSLERAMKGLFERDDNLCVSAIADDEEIDQLEKQIDKDGVGYLVAVSTGCVRSAARRFGHETFIKP